MLYEVITETVEADVTVARSIVALGRALGLKTIAEGIETPGQAAILRDLGCNVGQGYLFAKPMPAAAASAWFAGRHSGARVGALD